MLNKIKEAYKKYIELGYNSRTSEPANIVHDAIRDLVISQISEDDNFSVRTNNNIGEYKFSSEVHEKKIDITLIDNDLNKPILAISFKMPLSSVNKNLKNYFEMNIGDSTLVREGGTPFYFFMVLDENSIKFSNSIYKDDPISQKSIEPFKKVISSKIYSSFRPNFIFITKVNFGDKSFKRSLYGERKSEVISRKNEQISIINNFDPIATVYLSDGTWDNDFENCLNSFKQTIKLEIELYRIRKNL